MPAPALPDVSCLTEHETHSADNCYIIHSIYEATGSAFAGALGRGAALVRRRLSEAGSAWLGSRSPHIFDILGPCDEYGVQCDIKEDMSSLVCLC